MPTILEPVRETHKPTLRDVMRWKGPEWTANCLRRRYNLKHRHADLVVGMLGVRSAR